MHRERNTLKIKRKGKQWRSPAVVPLKGGINLYARVLSCKRDMAGDHGLFLLRAGDPRAPV